MPRLALANMALGFLVLTVVAAAGAFIAFDLTDAYLTQPENLSNWSLAIQRSAHGHTNLFGMIHVLFGLTMPYSKLSQRLKFLQTLGLSLGTIAMGPIMLWRSHLAPTASLDLNGMVMGVFLSCALLALTMHVYGLVVKLFR